MSNAILNTALRDADKAYKGFKATREKMLDKLNKDSEKLAPKYKIEEQNKYNAAISNLRISYKRTLQTLLEDTRKAVASTSLPAPLSAEQMRILDGNKYFNYSPEEWANIAHGAMLNKDLGYLRAIKNVAAGSGITLNGLPLSEAEAMNNLEKVVNQASKLSADNLEDAELRESIMQKYIDDTLNGLSLYNSDGTLKEITAEVASENPFLQGLNGGEN